MMGKAGHFASEPWIWKERGSFQLPGIKYGNVKVSQRSLYLQAEAKGNISNLGLVGYIIKNVSYSQPLQWASDSKSTSKI